MNVQQIVAQASTRYTLSPRYYENVAPRLEGDSIIRASANAASMSDWKRGAKDCIRAVGSSFDPAYCDALGYAVALGAHERADSDSVDLLQEMLVSATQLQAGLGTLRYRIVRALYQLIERGLRPSDDQSLWMQLRTAPREHPDFGLRTMLWAARVRALIAPRRVFIAHGRDKKTRDLLAEWLFHSGVEPVILAQQLDAGMTIVEKLEGHTRCVYALSLLTPDDEARLRGTSEELVPRARQNVVFEHGLFQAKLGRARVRMICHPDVEMPSDLMGIAHTSCTALDDDALTELNRELVAVELFDDSTRSPSLAEVQVSLAREERFGREPYECVDEDWLRKQQHGF